MLLELNKVRSNLEQLTLNHYDPDFGFGESGKFATDEYPFSKKVYENSPLNRVLEEGFVGEDWQPTDQSGSSDGNTQKNEYLVNASTDYVRIWTVSGYSASSNSCYSAGQLYKNKTEDADGNVTVEYKDKLGFVVCKDVIMDGAADLRTYYIYDKLGLLRFVLPPKMVQSHIPSGSTPTTLTRLYTTVKNYCYYYEYDDRARLVEKQLPGSGTIYLVYDNRDRLVATQDEEQRNSYKWTFIRYDVLDRQICTGEFTYNTSRSNMQSLANSYSGTSLYEEENLSGYHDYTDRTFPHNYVSSESDFLTVTYYDDYNGFPSGYALSNYSLSGISGYDNISAADFESSCTATTTGLVTGTKTKNLDNGAWYFTVNYYDNKGRLIQSRSQNHLSGSDRISYAYNLITDEILATVNEHSTSYDDIDIGQRFVYDHSGRSLEEYHQILGEDEILVSGLKYNVPAQLLEKYLYSEDNTSTKGTYQLLDYTYNIRGWLTSVNDPDELEFDLYGLELAYNDPSIVSSSLGADPFYNGNISAMKWKSHTNSLRAYAYDYDNANRLTEANYGYSGNWTISAYDVTNITYDANGNILTIKRRDGSQIIDDLSITYTGNQLKSVTDNGSLSLGFTYSGSPSDYVYNENGNLKRDYYKGINFDIEYNYLNLPILLDFGINEIEFIYNASGTKLQKKVFQTSTTTTDYINNIVYEGGDLQYILFSEGLRNFVSVKLD